MFNSLLLTTSFPLFITVAAIILALVYPLNLVTAEGFTNILDNPNLILGSSSNSSATLLLLSSME